MKIEELRVRRIKLEEDIAAAVGALVDKFNTDTGFSPYSISVGMDCVTFVGDKERKYVVGSCSVSIEI